MIEKPQSNPPSNCASLGRYILRNSIFDYLKNIKAGVGGEIQITDALASAIQHEKVYATKLKGTCHDTGSRVGFVKANLDYAASRTDIIDEVKNYLNNDLKDYYK